MIIFDLPIGAHIVVDYRSKNKTIRKKSEARDSSFGDENTLLKSSSSNRFSILCGDRKIRVSKRQAYILASRRMLNNHGKALKKVMNVG